MLSPLLVLALTATTPAAGAPTAAPAEAVADKPGVSVTEGAPPPEQARRRIEIKSDNVDLAGAGWLDFKPVAAPIMKALMGAPITEGKGELLINHAGRVVTCMAGSSGPAEKAEEALCEQIKAHGWFHLNTGYDLPFEVGRLGFTMRLYNVLTPRRPIVIAQPDRGSPGKPVTPATIVTIVTTGKPGTAGCSILNSAFSETDSEAICAAWIAAGKPGLAGKPAPAGKLGPRASAPQKPAALRTPTRGDLVQISVPTGISSWDIIVRERPIWKDMEIVYPGAQVETLPKVSLVHGHLNSAITPADYPALALREEMEGKVLALIGFGREGTPLSCRPLTSSGTAYLDNATCEIITRRLRYEFDADMPAFSGKRYYIANIRWVVPTDIIF